jgi:nucleoside-diphosphate-sugar epimerase
MRHTFAETFLARVDLEFQPKVGLEEGLRATVAFLRA